MTDSWPLRYVGVYCDRCGTVEKRDIRVDTAEEAIEALRELLNTSGWDCDPGGDLCPDCRESLRAAQS